MPDTDTTTEVQRFKTMLYLPPEVARAFEGLTTETRDSYIAALRQGGWTLSSIADASGITRERVRQISKGFQAVIVDGVEVEPARDPMPLVESLDLALPDPPAKPIKVRKQYTEPKPETLEKLLQLQPKAQRYRANSVDPQAKADAQAYSKLIYETATQENVPLYRLALRLGVTHGALRERLKRYGYR